MILQALYQYTVDLRQYQAENSDGIEDKLPAPGMEWKAIPYRIIIRPDGTFVEIRRATDAPQEVAKAITRSGQKPEAQILWDNVGFVLGVPGLKETKSIQDLLSRFARFMSRIESLPDDIEVFRPVKLFYAKKEYEKARLADIISEIKKDDAISFELEGANGRLITSHPSVRPYFDPARIPEDNDSPRGTCLVTGLSDQYLTKIHNQINVSGNVAPLVSFQTNVGLDSYCKKQGFNAPISITASDNIVTALKHLLAKGKETNYNLAGTTYIFWNSHPDRKLLQSYAKATFEGIRNNNDEDNDEDNTSETKQENKRRSKKKVSNEAVNPEEDTRIVLETLRATIHSKERSIFSKVNDRFYLLGLMPNQGRIAVKLWVEGSVQEIVANTLQHLDDMNIVHRDGTLDTKYPPLRSLYTLVGQLKPAGKKLDKFSESLIQSIVQSIVTNSPYPTSLQKLCLERIHHERNVGEWKAAILKAYLNRKYRQLNKEEIIPMALDCKQTNRAYLLGRLFAVLEKVQSDASGGVNASIRDRYYSIASTKPSSIFARLIELSNHHFKKLNRQRKGFALSKEVEEIIGAIDGGFPSLPTYFNADEQSTFAIGYYHQRTNLWAKKEDRVENNENNND